MSFHFTPTLYVFSGLPAVGKSTLAKHLVRHTGSMYVRIDTVEQGLRDLCDCNVEGEGYRLSYRIVQDNLRLGMNVVSDCCNPIALTRKEWRQVAEEAGARLVNVEVCCSDSTEHERRVRQRFSDVMNLILPTWEAVLSRHYDTWQERVIRLDTAGKSVDASLAELIERLALAEG